MKKELLIPQSNLEDIIGRLICCNALIDALRQAMDDDDHLVDAMAGASDLLKAICRDFQADIDCAEVYAEKGVPA